VSESAPQPLALDHLPFAVLDLEAARVALAGLGFTTTDTGLCRWRLGERDFAARCASVVFDCAYFDLIELRGSGADRLRNASLFHRGMTPTGVVLRSADLDADRARLVARGLPCGEPYPIVRDLPGADPPQIAYRLFGLRGDGAPFAVIHDPAPRALRQPRWLEHANTALGVRAVHVRAPGARARVPLPPRVVLHGAASHPYLADVTRLQPDSSRAALLAIEVEVADLAAARQHLAANGVPFRELPGGVAIEPVAGYGCGLAFRPGAA
jgi:hypothetical protein